MSETIFVLGSNSFAGSQFIASALNAEYSVVGVNRSAEPSDIFLPYRDLPGNPDYEFNKLDINRDFEAICDLLNQKKPEFIVDFAGQGMVAESWQDPLQWYQANFISKVKLHEFLRKQTWLQRYVRISTPEVYGSSESLIGENNHYLPSTPYAVSHAAIDMSLRTYFNQYDFPIIFTRYSNFYGPGQQLYRIIPRTIIYAMTGQKLQLHGGGKAIRAFIYGADVSSAVLATLRKGVVGESYHFSSSEFVSIKALVEMICDKMHIQFDDFVEMAPDRPGKDLRYLMDDSKAKQQLAWQPNTTLSSGIDATIEWVSKNLEEIKQLPLNYIHKD